MSSWIYFGAINFTLPAEMMSGEGIRKSKMSIAFTSAHPIFLRYFIILSVRQTTHPTY